jgi:hypothetical protein
MNDYYLFFVGTDKGTLIGVPARNLSYEEAKKFGITALLASGLYVYNAQHAIPVEHYQALGILDKLKDEDIEDKPKKKKRSKKESE